MTLVDVVNFNADASCLSSMRWMEILKGGKESEFYRWLNLYVKYDRKAVMGLTGATVADIAMFNPESITLINEHRTIFEILIRPFSHDIALFRSDEAFLINLDLGIKTLQKEFGDVTPYYLPPEFMCTSKQVALLKKKAIEGIFINPRRFDEEISQRIPKEPYMVKGVSETELYCVPFRGELTQAYLNTMHWFDSTLWNDAVEGVKQEVAYLWRDGESSFFIPDGITREAYWLETESEKITREHLRAVRNDSTKSAENSDAYQASYPIHSFTAWMKEMRMLWYLKKVESFEHTLDFSDLSQVAVWLQIINSDVFSSVEKKSPRIKIKKAQGNDASEDFVIRRSERGYEAEDALSMTRGELENLENKKELAPHACKLLARKNYLKNFF